jgi:hypothetical protein
MVTRTFHDRVSDFMWGAPDPSPEDRKQLEQIRASARSEARQAEEIYLAELDRVGAGRGVMAPPPRPSTKSPARGKANTAELMRARTTGTRGSPRKNTLGSGTTAGSQREATGRAQTK